jgi:hypothetical protein
LPKTVSSEELAQHKEMRDKEMADRIKYIDQRSKARLEAARALAADREAKANTRP